MSEQAAWFKKPIDTTPKASSFDSAKNWPFFMELDEDVRIAILNKDDDDIPPMHYHNAYVDGRVVRVGCTEAEHLGGYCHLCEYTKQQAEKDQWKTEQRQEFCYTILDDRGKKKDGEKLQPMKRLRLSTVSDDKNIKKLREIAVNDMERGGIHLTWIKAVRDSNTDKAPKVGVLKQILDPVKTDKFDDEFLEPFSIEEILVQFVVDPDEIEKINEAYPLSTGQVSRAQIKEIV